MYVRNDAITFWYCSTKCRKNSFYLKRDPRKLKWTRVPGTPSRTAKKQEASSQKSAQVK
jgi:ribosomal protein L24E